MFKLLFSFIVLFLTSYSYSQVTNPFFYEVTYEGKKSYILGSFHIGIGVNEFPSMVMEKFKNSKTHAYEMIIADEDYLNTLKMIHENPDEAVLKRYDEDSKKKTLLSVESQNKLMNLGIPKSFACKMTDSPESCFVVVYKDYVFNQEYKSIDLEFQVLSQKLDKEIVELENDEIRNHADELDQDAGFDGPTLEEFLECCLSYLETSSHEADAFIENYRKGNVESEDETLEPGMKYRNLSWMPKIKELLRRGDSFIIFGVAHLYGKYGILTLLEALGANVERFEP